MSNFTILMTDNFNLLNETFQKDTIDDNQATKNNDNNFNVFGEKNF